MLHFIKTYRNFLDIQYDKDVRKYVKYISHEIFGKFEKKLLLVCESNMINT